MQHAMYAQTANANADYCGCKAHDSHFCTFGKLHVKVSSWLESNPSVPKYINMIQSTC